MLTVAEVGLLVPLRYADQPVTAIRLTEILGMSRAGVSKTLTKLERRECSVAQPIRTIDDSTVGCRHSYKSMTYSPRELEAHAQLLAGLG